MPLLIHLHTIGSVDRLDVMLGIMATATALVVPAAAIAIIAGYIEMLELTAACMVVVVFAFVGFSARMRKRLIRMRENRDAWVRICCTYRRGLRERIDRGEFPTPRENMAAMDHMDGEERRVAEDYKKWQEEQDVVDAMPK